MKISRVLQVAFVAAIIPSLSIFEAKATTEPALPVIPEGKFIITEYGATGDGLATNTTAIQKTIEACIHAGGGTVVIPRGIFLTGPLTLGSKLRLQVEKEGSLRILNDIASYPRNERGCVNSISAENCHDLEISGDGEIDGQGEIWWKGFRADKAGFVRRPYMVFIKGCSRVLVRGIHLKNSPCFHLVPQQCTDLTIRDVTITAPADSPNTDAIDPSGWNYLITGCRLDVGDDNIAIKAGGDHHSQERRPSCTNFTVTDCTFLHGHGLSIGSETYGGLNGLTVRDCTFDGTTSGIRMKSNREKGGLVENLCYENITMNHVKTPISIASYYPKTPVKPSDDPATPVKIPAPLWKNIVIRNLKAVDSTNAGVIWGLPELPVTDVTLESVNISATTGMRIYNARGIRFTNSTISNQQGEKLMIENAEVSGL